MGGIAQPAALPPSADWLSQLAPAHAPPPIGWWPPAPGWWLLGLLLIGLLSALLAWWRNPGRRLRAQALAELRQLRAQSGDDAALARDLEHLLRRYAVARYGRAQVAPLSGAAWLDFVADHGGSAWAGGAGAQLLRAAYSGVASGDRALWLHGAQGFLKYRRPLWRRRDTRPPSSSASAGSAA